MSKELKPCPFCGDLLEIVHKNGSKYVRCISGTCIFETARHGYHISDNELIKRCNRRPAENALTAEVERLKAENRELRTLCSWRKNLLCQCVTLSRLCFPKKDYSKDSLFKIINQIYMLVLAADDAPDTEKGGEDE